MPDRRRRRDRSARAEARMGARAMVPGRAGRARVQALPRALLGALRRRRHAPVAGRAGSGRRGARARRPGRRRDREVGVARAPLPRSRSGSKADVVVGHVYGDEKRDALIEHGATIYVGDTITDVRAGARRRRAPPSASRPACTTARRLPSAGADRRVLDSLDDFPAWLAHERLRPRRRAVHRCRPTAPDCAEPRAAVTDDPASSASSSGDPELRSIAVT